MPASPAVLQPYENVRFLKEKGPDYITKIPLYKTEHEVESKQSIITKAIDSVVIPAKLIPTPIKDKIEKSKKIFSLEYNWDDCGASTISKVAFKNAIDFLEKYAERILDVSCKELIPPEIVPVKDGSVDLEWNLKNSYLLINFRSEDIDNALYYLAYKDGDIITFDANGQINTKNINDKFASNLVDLS